MIGWSPEQTENESLARVWQLDAQYWLAFDHDRQARAFNPAVMVETWPEPPAKIWVLSAGEDAAGTQTRMV